MPEQDSGHAEFAAHSTADGASHPAGDAPGQTSEPRSVEELRVEIWTAVQNDILPTFQIDRIVGELGPETAFRVSATATAFANRDGQAYRDRVQDARYRIGDLTDIGGEASSYRAFVRMHLWDTGVRTGWWSKADIKTVTSDGDSWQTITSDTFRAVADAMDAVLFRSLLAEEQFAILVEPMRVVVGSVWEIRRRS